MTWKHVLAVDVDPWACRTYRANMPGVPVVCARVEADWIGHELRETPVDVVLGGPPCQPYSAAGEGRGAADERCGFDAFVDVVSELRPRHAIAENVPGVLYESHAESYLAYLRQLELIGYVVRYAELDAADYGVPQNRRRVWAWAVRCDLAPLAPRWPEATHAEPGECETMFGSLRPWVTCGDAIDAIGQPARLPGASGYNGQRISGAGRPAPTVIGSASPEFIRYRWSDAYRSCRPPAELSRPSPTILAQFAKGAPNGMLAVDTAQGERVRRLTPDECLRLQSAPDDFAWPEGITKTAKYRIAGNGWACLMAHRMAEAVRAVDPEATTVVDLFAGGGLGAVGWSGRYWAWEGVAA